MARPDKRDGRGNPFNTTPFTSFKDVPPETDPLRKGGVPRIYKKIFIQEFFSDDKLP